MRSVCSAAIKVRLKCDNPFCNNYFFADKRVFKDINFKFCRECREAHSYPALVIQKQENMRIEEVMKEAALLFRSALRISDYLGISTPTFYAWVRHYFGTDFQSWKRQHICKSKTCMVVDFSCMPITYKYHLSEVIRKNRACSCFTESRGKTLLITSMKPYQMREAFRNSPEIVSTNSGINVVRYPVRMDRLSIEERGIPDNEKEQESVSTKEVTPVKWAGLTLEEIKF